MKGAENAMSWNACSLVKGNLPSNIIIVATPPIALNRKGLGGNTTASITMRHKVEKTRRCLFYCTLKIFGLYVNAGREFHSRAGSIIKDDAKHLVRLKGSIKWGYFAVGLDVRW